MINKFDQIWDDLKNEFPFSTFINLSNQILKELRLLLFEKGEEILLKKSDTKGWMKKLVLAVHHP